MNFDFNSIIEDLKFGASFIEKLVPIVTAHSNNATVNKVADFANTIAEVATNVTDNAQQAGVVLSSSNQDEINVVMGRLSAANDLLTAQIVADKPVTKPAVEAATPQV